MMESKTHTALNHWIEAETEGGEGAEAAFDAVFASLPRLTPAAGFTERVLWAVQSAPVEHPSRAFAGGRIATLAALVFAGLSVLLLPLVRFLPFELPSLGVAIKGGAQAVAWTAAWFDAGLASWRVLARIGQAVETTAATPEFAAAFVVSAMMGACAFYGLNHLLEIERRTWS